MKGFSLPTPQAANAMNVAGFLSSKLLSLAQEQVPETALQQQPEDDTAVHSDVPSVIEITSMQDFQDDDDDLTMDICLEQSVVEASVSTVASHDVPSTVEVRPDTAPPLSSKSSRRKSNNNNNTHSGSASKSKSKSSKTRKEHKKHHGSAQKSSKNRKSSRRSSSGSSHNNKKKKDKSKRTSSLSNGGGGAALLEDVDQNDGLEQGGGDLLLYHRLDDEDGDNGAGEKSAEPRGQDATEFPHDKEQPAHRQIGLHNQDLPKDGTDQDRQRENGINRVLEEEGEEAEDEEDLLRSGPLAVFHNGESDVWSQRVCTSHCDSFGFPLMASSSSQIGIDGNDDDDDDTVPRVAQEETTPFAGDWPEVVGKDRTQSPDSANTPESTGQPNDAIHNKKDNNNSNDVDEDEDEDNSSKKKKKSKNKSESKEKKQHSDAFTNRVDSFQKRLSQSMPVPLPLQRRSSQPFASSFTLGASVAGSTSSNVTPAYKSDDEGLVTSKNRRNRQHQGPDQQQVPRLSESLKQRLGLSLNLFNQLAEEAVAAPSADATSVGDTSSARRRRRKEKASRLDAEALKGFGERSFDQLSMDSIDEQLMMQQEREPQNQSLDHDDDHEASPPVARRTRPQSFIDLTKEDLSGSDKKTRGKKTKKHADDDDDDDDNHENDKRDDDSDKEKWFPSFPSAATEATSSSSKDLSVTGGDMPPVPPTDSAATPKRQQQREDVRFSDRSPTRLFHKLEEGQAMQHQQPSQLVN